jgi:hypothetical protein
VVYQLKEADAMAINVSTVMCPGAEKLSAVQKR